MVKFGDLVKDKKRIPYRDLERLFESLDRQTSHTELRPTQIEALKSLSKRRSDKEIVLKVSTGGGKTAVGLLFLFGHMLEHTEPAVYLCPTVQLVDQVLAEAENLGIPAAAYPAGERYPTTDGAAGREILVCTYEKLFNARTTFEHAEVKLRPCALVLDDAHAGVERVRNAYTLHVGNRHSLYQRAIDLFSPHLRKYRPGLWRDIVAGDPTADIEVPFWIWSAICDEVRSLFENIGNDDPASFAWLYIRDAVLRWCRCVMSANGVDIAPHILPVEYVRAFAQAKHRLFMSATLADDSVLVRELACSRLAASNPVRPTLDRGIGERMVIAPSLISSKLDREWTIRLAKELAKGVNVVVLCPSQAVAADWVHAGAVLPDDIVKTVRELRDRKTGTHLVVLVQRYDGIDLPDNACRVLILDGIPFGESQIDRYDSRRSDKPGGVRNKIIYRIEQGMGRAVRSHADYAVAILAGPDLAQFVGLKHVLSAMNSATRAQLELAGC